jgi:hypothetical protein
MQLNYHSFYLFTVDYSCAVDITPVVPFVRVAITWPPQIHTESRRRQRKVAPKLRRRRRIFSAGISSVALPKYERAFLFVSPTTVWRCRLH